MKNQKEENISFKYYNSKKTFYNKNILVTGATGGIGSLLVKTLNDLGANIACLVKDKQKFDMLFKDEERISCYIEDFSVRSYLQNIFSEIMLAFKGKLDILIMCHGKYYMGLIEETPFNVFDYGVNINFRSCFALLSLATPFLKMTKGNVVAISSLESYIPVKSGLINSVTKSMVNSLIENAALELASFGVRVNGVAPGITNTSHRVGINEDFKEKENKQFMSKLGESHLLYRTTIIQNNEERSTSTVVQPQDIVDAILFLASDDAAFITGEILKVDNGYSLNHDLSFTAQSEEDNSIEKKFKIEEENNDEEENDF